MNLTQLSYDGQGTFFSPKVQYFSLAPVQFWGLQFITVICEHLDPHTALYASYNIQLLSYCLHRNKLVIFSGFFHRTI